MKYDESAAVPLANLEEKKSSLEVLLFANNKVKKVLQIISLRSLRSTGVITKIFTFNALRKIILGVYYVTLG